MDLSNKVAIVTGASRGIGRAIAERLGKAGAKVVINYNRNAEPAQALAQDIGGVAVQADVSTDAGCQALIEAAKALGSVDILVNNAGITRDGLMVRMSDEDWSDVMETNLNSTFRLCRAATEIMMRQRAGSIINVTSVSGIRGNAGQANYAASKAAVAHCGAEAWGGCHAGVCDAALLRAQGGRVGAARGSDEHTRPAAGPACA